MFKVYIAGPYTGATPEIVEENVQAAIKAAAELIAKGFAPFCPHLFHFIEKDYPQPYQRWIDIDNSFVRDCNAMLRLPGNSPGADKEVALATRYSIPVVNSISEVCDLLYMPF